MGGGADIMSNMQTLLPQCQFHLHALSLLSKMRRCSPSPANINYYTCSRDNVPHTPGVQQCSSASKLRINLFDIVRAADSQVR